MLGSQPCLKRGPAIFFFARLKVRGFPARRRRKMRRATRAPTTRQEIALSIIIAVARRITQFLFSAS